MNENLWENTNEVMNDINCDNAEKTEIENAEDITQGTEEGAVVITDDAEPKKKKTKRNIIITAAILVVLIIAAAILTPTVILPNIEYNNVMKLIEENKSDEAYAIVCKSRHKKVSVLKDDFLILPTMMSSEDGTAERYTYDKNGNLLKIASKGPLWDKIEESRDYDESGNIIRTVYEIGGEIYIYTYEYDKYGNIIKETFKFPYRDKVTYTYSYEYDENGMIEKERSFVDGEIDTVTKYSYFFNKDDSIISIRGKTDDGREDVYYFNEAGDYTEVCGSIDGYINEKSTYEYDENGRLIREIYENIEEGDRTTIEYRYDREGKLIKEITNGETAFYSDFHYYYSPVNAVKERENDVSEFMK